MQFSNRKAIYLQIVDYVCEEVLMGAYPLDSKMTSIRDLAASLGVNPNTIVRSVEKLQQLKIIRSERGIGHFITKNAVDKAKSFLKESFIKNDLPVLFKNVQLLDYDFKELEAEYQTYLLKQKRK